MAGEFLINICQILCFPFGIDANEDLISKAYSIIKDYNFFNKILSACIEMNLNKKKDSNNLTFSFDIPCGLLARLVLSDEDLTQSLIDQINTSNEVCNFFIKLFYPNNANKNSSSDTLLSDLFTIFSHLSRKSEEIIPALIRILKGEQQESFDILTKSLLSQNSLLKSRCCNMLGNLMRHNDLFYDVLKRNKQIFESLVKCCQIEELNVRKSAVFAIGNSVYHNELLYAYVEDILGILIKLLNDSVAKTRIHSTGKI
jgi:hypothetical protein